MRMTLLIDAMAEFRLVRGTVRNVVPSLGGRPVKHGLKGQDVAGIMKRRPATGIMLRGAPHRAPCRRVALPLKQATPVPINTHESSSG